MVRRQRWPKIHHHDARSVERVIQKGSAEKNLSHLAWGARIKEVQIIVELRVRPDHEDADNMSDQEGRNSDPRDAVEGPGDHPLSPAIGDRPAKSVSWCREG